jgi:hypothetical protein
MMKRIRRGDKTWIVTDPPEYSKALRLPRQPYWERLDYHRAALSVHGLITSKENERIRRRILSRRKVFA